MTQLVIIPANIQPFCWKLSLRRASFVCLVLTLWLLPFPVRLPLDDGFGGNSLTALDIYPADLAALGAILYGLVGWLPDRHLTKSWPFQARSGMIAAVGLVGWAALSLVWASEPRFGQHMLARLGLGLILGWAVMYRSAAERRFMAAVLFAGGSLQGAIALWQFVRQEAVSLIFWPTVYAPQIRGSSVVQVGPGRDFILRSYGTLSHPNVLGGYLVLAFLAGVWLWLGLKRSSPEFRPAGADRINMIGRGLLLLGLSLIMTGLVVSFSRSAWLGLGLGLINLIGPKLLRFAKQKNWKLRRWGGWVVWLGLSLLLIASVATPLSSRLFRFDLPLERNSLEERVNYFRWSFEIIGQHPWLGAGLNNYTIFSATRPELGAAAHFPVHNVTLLLIGELGLPGGICWLVMLFMSLWRPGPELLWVAGISATALIAQFDHYLWTQPQSQLLWWLWLGLWLGNTRLERL